jgi:hypothetical protein
VTFLALHAYTPLRFLPNGRSRGDPAVRRKAQLGLSQLRPLCGYKIHSFLRTVAWPIGIGLRLQTGCLHGLGSERGLALGT